MEMWGRMVLQDSISVVTLLAKMSDVDARSLHPYFLDSTYLCYMKPPDCKYLIPTPFVPHRTFNMIR